MPFAEFVRLAKETGYPAVCVRASAGGVQTPEAELRAMRRVLDESNLAVSMVTTDFNVPLNNDDGPANPARFRTEFARGGTAGRRPDSRLHEGRGRYTGRGPGRRHGAERGVRVAHQCHTNSLFETVEQILETIRRVDRDNFGLIYEPANLMLCGQPYAAETLKRLAPHLMNVYVQNHRLSPSGDVTLPTRVRGAVRYFDLPLWEAGGVDFNAVFAGLRAIGYRGYVTVHQQYAKLMGPEEAAVGSYKFLQAAIGNEPNRQCGGMEPD